MTFQNEFKINDKPVGADHPVFVIAEAGVAHFGSVEKAFQLVELAAQAGADAFKTQFFDVDALIASREESWKERLRPRNLTFAEAQAVKKLCDERGLIFMSTAHDESRISWLEKLAVPAIKIGSGERRNFTFIKKLSTLKKPMILSTGMYQQADVDATLAFCDAIGQHALALLHCVTSYPTPADQVNLRVMDSLKACFAGPVGYSDHTENHLACLGAVARGAKIIERHITLDRDVPNAQDWKVSSGPENFSALIQDIRTMEKLLGHSDIQTVPCELQSVHWATKSLVAARDLPAGQVLTAEDIAIKRPGDGMRPDLFESVLGKKLTMRLEKDALLKEEELM